ncbi:MAG: helix-turn-helix domain-containing protein [Defluviitaleaceae bacterium]|nr:helix-turn-helix domain-containing protein [Defluviitaleaceae bacterium]
MQIGEKIKQLRVRTGLTQEELANRCDLSKGFISQVERELTSPSIATLIDILESLGTNLTGFFQEPASLNILFKPDDAYSTEDEASGYKIAWVVPSAQKNRMEPIIVTLRGGGRTGEYAPHEGEVFGYVVSGSVTVHLGNKKWKAKRGECFYYGALESYFVENQAKREAVFVWVAAPPSF